MKMLRQKVARHGCAFPAAGTGGGIADKRHRAGEGRTRGQFVRHAFRRAVRYRPIPDPDAPNADRPAAAAPKVSAPSYYDYKADPLVHVDFAALRALPESPTVRARAREPRSPAAAGLDGFDLLAEKDIGKALVDYYAAKPRADLGERRRPQRQGRRGAAPARRGRELRANAGRLRGRRAAAAGAAATRRRATPGSSASR